MTGYQWLVATLLPVFIVAGCSERGKYPVSGVVTFEGKPVNYGTISFVPVEPGAHPDAGRIENGRFHLLVAPGVKRVEITASRPLPPEKQEHPELGTAYEDYLPAQFNTETTLSAEILPGHNPELTFSLEL
jgi:hypothetical protein